MDYNIFLILHKDYLKKLDIIEIKAKWLGEYYSYSPRRFSYCGLISLKSSDYDFNGVVNNINLKNKIVLEVAENLNELQEISNNGGNIEANGIVQLLKKITELKSYYIIIFEDDEKVNQYIVDEMGIDINDIIKKTFNWKNPQNIMIYKE
ncbi:MAG: hypothetical protein K6G26_08855 [Lachnospiraceae bacterium]|nr:hypothetical protein [Lachnospiraceae bacterium]